MERTCVGIDLGGTKIFGARVEFDAASGVSTIAEDGKVDTPRGGVDEVIGAVATLVRQLDDAPDAVGVGTPGVVPPGTGRVLFAPNLAGFDEPVELGPRLADQLGCPVAVANDVNVATLGEARAGAAVGAPDVLAVWLGTGLGAGLILDGRLRVGPTGLAGELGHTVVIPGGRECGCGARGHLEAYIGRRALEAEARRRHAAGRTTSLVEMAGDGPMKSKTFRAAYDAGDEVTHELLDEGLGLLAIAVANVALIVDVTTVVVGGGLGERFADVVVDRLDLDLAPLSFVGGGIIVRPAALGDHAGALGAAHLVMETHDAAPGVIPGDPG